MGYERRDLLLVQGWWELVCILWQEEVTHLMEADNLLTLICKRHRVLCRKNLEVDSPLLLDQ
jgi:hypothetical protein